MLSQKILSPPTNVGLQPPGPLLPKPASRDVLCCLIVDSTSSLRDHFKNIQQSFLTPFLSQLRLPLPIEFEGQMTKFTPSLKLGVVTYGDYLSNSPVVSHYFTSEHKLVLDYLNSLKFDNGGPCYSVVYEGLCSALEMFDNYQEQTGSDSVIEPIRHCILIGNSLPHACNIKFNQREENDNLSVQGVCQKLKKYKVNFSLISTNKLLDSLFVIPSLVNSENVPIMDYFRAGFDNYVAKLAGVVPPENFKAPGWLKIVDKDKRKFKDYDSEALAELKKTKPNFNETESNNSFTRPQDISRSNLSGPTPPSLSTPVQNSRGISAPRTPNTTEGPGQIGPQPCASPASDLYSTPLTNNHVGESSPLAAKTSTPANISSLDALNNNSDSSAMRRQSSSKSSRGGTRKSSGPKKPTKAQLKAQAKAAAVNSPLSSVSNIIKSPEASSITVDPSKQTTPQALSISVTQIPQDLGENNTANVPAAVPSSANSTPKIPVVNQQNIPDNILKSPQANLPTNPNQNTLQPFAGQTGSAGPLRSPNFSAPNTPNGQNVSQISTPVQQPNNNIPNPNAVQKQPNNSSTLPTNNQTISNNPTDPSRPPVNAPPAGNAQQIPGQAQNATPNAGANRQPNNPVWQGLVCSKVTPESPQELVGGIAVHPIDQSDAVRANFMTELWPKCLQLSSLIPCNVANIVSFSRNMQVPFFLIGTPQSIPDPTTNSKVVHGILSKIIEKIGVVKIEISVNGNNNHGLLLFRLNGKLLGTAFLKIPFPDLKAQLFAPVPLQATPSNLPANAAAVASAPNTNTQQVQQPNTFNQQHQQPLSGPALNQGMPMNMNAAGFNQLMAQNMAASGNLKNNQAMAMFQGMPMNLANQTQNVNNGMFMNNPGMVNPAMAMFNMEAQRRAQQNNGGMNPFNSMPPGMNMQQFTQMQNQNQNNFMLPQQLQQLAQFQLAQRQQAAAARPPNPRNPPQ